jgi:6-phospho-beta-glucosidase
MKVAVIGGGSTYTPELVSGLSRERERLDVRDLVLHDIDPERRDVVGGLARRMLDRQGFSGRLAVTDDLDRALDGADFVLLQIRVGGQAARLSDETVPLACGCIGQETTGAGGFGKALRTVPVVLEIAQRARELAAADAWIVDFTNPVGIVTRALLDAGHRAIGLCNVAIGMQRRIAQLLEVEPGRVLVDQVGLNHLTWIRAVLLDGADVLTEVLDRFGGELAAELDLPRQLLDELGAIPSYYLRYFYAHDAVLAAQRDGVPRAATVAEIERELLELYRDPALTEKPVLLERRGGAFYSEAATALVASLVADTGDVQVVDVRNGGAVAGLLDDDVVELPARIGRGGATSLPQRPLAPELLGLVQHVAAYERLAVEAALHGDRVTARKALLAHPLVGQWGTVDELVERLLAADHLHLPQFARVRTRRRRGGAAIAEAAGFGGDGAGQARS